MTRLRIGIWTFALLLVAGMGLARSQTEPRDVAMGQVAARSIGVADSAFEVTTEGTVLAVVRIGTLPITSTHEGRNNEADAIATAIADEFLRKAATYSGVQSIRIDYVERSGTPAHDRLLDRMIFRKTPAGKFERHLT